MLSDTQLKQALASPMATLPPSLAPGEEVVAAARSSDQWGVVVVMRRTLDGDIEDDTYVAARAADGEWVFPGTASGGLLPEWVLDRRRVDEPWSRHPLQDLGEQISFVTVDGDTKTIVAVALLVSPHIRRVTIRVGPTLQSIDVPASGFVVSALPVLDDAEDIQYEAFDSSGQMLASHGVVLDVELP